MNTYKPLCEMNLSMKSLSHVLHYKTIGHLITYNRNENHELLFDVQSFLDDEEAVKEVFGNLDKSRILSLLI